METRDIMRPVDCAQKMPELSTGRRQDARFPLNMLDLKIVSMRKVES